MHNVCFMWQLWLPWYIHIPLKKPKAVTSKYSIFTQLAILRISCLARMGQNFKDLASSDARANSTLPWVLWSSSITCCLENPAAIILRMSSSLNWDCGCVVCCDDCVGCRGECVDGRCGDWISGCPGDRGCSDLARASANWWSSISIVSELILLGCLNILWFVGISFSAKNGVWVSDVPMCNTLFLRSMQH